MQELPRVNGSTANQCAKSTPPKTTFAVEPFHDRSWRTRGAARRRCGDVHSPEADVHIPDQQAYSDLNSTPEKQGHLVFTTPIQRIDDVLSFSSL